MANLHVENRLQGISSILNGVHQAGASMSAASKGVERQAFIDNFLKEVLPPIYRFGSGDVTDLHGNKSGQLDVVVEYPIAPSLPSTAGSPRLYLAESLAAVIEVKSDLGSQWDEAVATASKLALVQRSFQNTMTFGGDPPGSRIPLFAVGYKGWSNLSTLQKYVADSPNIDGALAISSGLYCCKGEYGNFWATGPWALWGLICSLHEITSTLLMSRTNPLGYAIPNSPPPM
jgi:hypothetical protein